MPDLHLEVLRESQKNVWNVLRQASDVLSRNQFYLAGGTALALQIGHRESQDFDFFSQIPDIEAIRVWLESFSDLRVRDADAHTIHADLADVKLSFIADYRYPLVMPLLDAVSLKMASILDIALMKMLAITHRAAIRDYLDLAIILRDHCTLAELIGRSTEKYGANFNPLLCLRSMVHFEDLDQEMPVILDSTLAASWKDILLKAVKDMTA